MDEEKNQDEIIKEIIEKSNEQHAELQKNSLHKSINKEEKRSQD